MKLKFKYGYTNSDGKFGIVDFTATNAANLASSIIKFQLDHGVTPYTIDEVFDLIDKQNPKQDRKSNSILSRFKSKTAGNLRLHDVWTAAKAMVNIAKGSTVSQYEASRREAICHNCPLKTDTSDCKKCGGAKIGQSFINTLKHLTRMHIDFTKDTRTSYCGFCKCALSVILSSKLSAFKEKEDDEVNQQRPEPCWLRRDSHNYREE